MKRSMLAGLLCLSVRLAGAQETGAASAPPESVAPVVPPASADAAVVVEPAPPAPAPAAPKVEIIDLKIGKGKEAAPGRSVVVHYTGWLFSEKAKDQRGKKFDSSHNPGRTPIDFKLGTGRMIPGWEQGMPGMKAGGKRTLIIPPELGYGARGAGTFVPPNAKLVFEIELLKVQ